jgi:hypothetical protein
VRWVLLVEVVLAFLATAAFVALYARSAWWESPTGRLVMLWVAVTCAETGLFALSYVVRLPMAVFAVVFAGLDAVAVWRLVLLVRAQRADRRARAS